MQCGSSVSTVMDREKWMLANTISRVHKYVSCIMSMCTARMALCTVS